MFNGYKQNYTIKHYTYTTDSYGQKIKTLSSTGTINIFISLANKYNTEDNDMRILQSSHIGISDFLPSIGDIIGDKYEVTYIKVFPREKIIFMKEVESNGIEY